MKLESMSVRELNGLKERIALAIHRARNRERAQVKIKIEEIIRSAGLTMGEVLARNGRSRVKSRPAARRPRFVNPDNPAETWAGRGRRPEWLLAKLAKGVPLEQFSRR